MLNDIDRIYIIKHINEIIQKPSRHNQGCFRENEY